jgi:hypothetical protein
MTDWVRERLPLERMVNILSPGITKLCILRQISTWSIPEFVRESEASTSP